MLSEQKFANDITIQYTLHPKKNRAGGYTIYVRLHFFQRSVRLERAETTVSTGVKCTPDKWNGTTVAGKDVGAQMKREKLTTVLTTVKEALYDLKKAGVSSVTVLKKEIEIGVKRLVTNKVPKGKKHDFLSQLQKHTLEAVKDHYLSTKNPSKRHGNRLGTLIKFFNEFKGHAVTVDEIDVNGDLEAFGTWLKVSKGHAHNTVITYLNKLRTILKHAMSQKLIPVETIKKGVIKSFKVGKRERLTDSELLQIFSVPDANLTEALKRTKYTFLFMAATGMGYGEMKAVRREHIETVKKQLYLKKRREKTDELFQVPFSPVAQSIYNDYFNWITHQTGLSTTTEPFANLPSIDYTLRSLKQLAKIAGLEKNITTYVGRHTFASNWIANDGNLMVLRDILGHTDIKTTQIYVNLLPETIIQKSKDAYKKSKFHNLQIV